MSFLPQVLSEYRELQWRIEGDEIYDNIIMIKGVKPSESEINTKIALLETEYNEQEYARQRQVEYPSIEECVHAILDDTLDALQAKRAEIKLKYPKGG